MGLGGIAMGKAWHLRAFRSIGFTGIGLLLAGVALSVTACASNVNGSAGIGGGTGSLGSADATTSTSPTPPAAQPGTPTAPATTTSPVAQVTVTVTAKPAAPLKCSQLKSAYVGSTTVSYAGYHDSIPLGDGLWSGEDGNTVTLDTPCAIGDVNGDGAADAVGDVVLTTNGSEQLYTLVVWKNVKSKPQFLALKDVGDRNPVVSISIIDEKVTVVYRTRTDGTPMYQLNIQRTAIYQLSGHTLKELSHTDQPYSGS